MNESPGFDWKKELQRCCWNVPHVVMQGEVMSLIREFLKERQIYYDCRYCSKNFHAGTYLAVAQRSCPECKRSRREGERLRRESSYKAHELESEARAEGMFIAGRGSPAKRFHWMEYNAVSQEICEALRRMSYKDFLFTIYWKTVRDYALYRAKWKCSLCYKTTGLQVHHKTYENHGYEHAHIEDLIVLCSHCHGTFHGKLPMDAENELLEASEGS